MGVNESDRLQARVRSILLDLTAALDDARRDGWEVNYAVGVVHGEVNGFAITHLELSKVYTHAGPTTRK